MNNKIINNKIRQVINNKTINDKILKYNKM